MRRRCSHSIIRLTAGTIYAGQPPGGFGGDRVEPFAELLFVPVGSGQRERGAWLGQILLRHRRIEQAELYARIADVDSDEHGGYVHVLARFRVSEAEGLSLIRSASGRFSILVYRGLRR